MEAHNNDTIIALATPVGRGGIGIVRLSGPAALGIAEKIFKPMTQANWQAEARRLTLGWACDENGNHLDQVLAVYFPAPHSYTTEDVVEIHAHGSPAVLRNIEKRCLEYGARLALPGEFTLRAFLGGRLDLSQAEAVGQLIQARSEQESNLAMLNLEGGLSRKLKPLRSSLLALTAQVEALLDYPEDQEEVDIAAFWQELEKNLLQPVEKLLYERQRGRIFREGALLTLCGRPNAGKSSLFNALLGKDKALVSHYPGTTRDGLQDEVIIQGVVCRLQDTAGLGQEAAEAGDIGGQLAQMGQLAARKALQEADLLLVLLDSSAALTDEDQEILEISRNFPHLLLASKADLDPAWPLTDFSNILPVSVRQGGLQQLEEEIMDALLNGNGESVSGQVVVSARQSQQLTTINEALLRTKDLLASLPVGWELIAWELQQCLFSLGALDGQGAPDEVLEEIFSTFCLGK